MKYLRTHQATSFPEKEDRSTKLIRLLLFWIPDGIPDYKNKMHLIKEWLLEFNDQGYPNREIGLDAKGKPVVAGPDDRNYGFWMDTNMMVDDFDKDDTIDEEMFSKFWNEYYRVEEEINDGTS